MVKENAGSQQIIFRLSGSTLAKLILSQPIGAFIVCVALSIIYDLEASTATHCKVKNYLPSISSAIGGFTPQRYIWRICIALHCAPRFMIAVMYYNYYKSFKVSNRRGLYNFLVFLNMVLNIAENACLVILTCVSSTENYGVHENSFIGFMIFSEVYMLLTLRLFTWSKAGRQWSEREIWSFRYKVSFFLMNLTVFGAAIYFFWRHNTYCEPGVYSLFALCEYFIVATNIGFHASCMVPDLGHTVVAVHLPMMTNSRHLYDIPPV